MGPRLLRTGFLQGSPDTDLTPVDNIAVALETKSALTFAGHVPSAAFSVRPPQPARIHPNLARLAGGMILMPYLESVQSQMRYERGTKGKTQQHPMRRYDHCRTCVE
jgi:hypothetical protein